MKLSRHIHTVAVFLSFGFLCLVTGALTAELKWYPYPFLRRAIVELAAHEALWRSFSSPYKTDFYTRVGSSKAGVTRYDPERAYKGHTLFTSAHTQGAFLIDMQGRIVHKWFLPFRKVWNQHAAVHHPAPPQLIQWRKAYLYPNGGLIALYVAENVTPWGYGLVKMTSDSVPIWTYLGRTHHDVTVGPDGRIYTSTYRIDDNTVPGLPAIVPPSIEDFVVEVSPDGTLLKKVSAYKAFATSQFRDLVNTLPDSTEGDTLHVNTLSPPPESSRKIFPFAGPDTVLISCRNLDSIALLDLNSEKIIWALRGLWFREHDPEFLSDGHMILFDNHGDLARGGESRVVEFDPNPLRVVWEYPGNTPNALYGDTRGAVQKLPNGNVLITEANRARLIEVTPDKKVVWEYRIPFRVGDHKQYSGILCWAHRFGPHELTFLNRQGTDIPHRQREATSK